MPPLTTGQQAELIAKDYLLDQGLAFHSANFRSRVGEIDLIFQDKHTWVFVEVKNRKNDLYGSAIEWVTASKQRKIIQTAKHFCLHYSLPANSDIRFDVIGMTNLTARSIVWVKHAFISDGS